MERIPTDDLTIDLIAALRAQAWDEVLALSAELMRRGEKKAAKTGDPTAGQGALTFAWRGRAEALAARGRWAPALLAAAHWLPHDRDAGTLVDALVARLAQDPEELEALIVERAAQPGAMASLTGALGALARRVPAGSLLAARLAAHQHQVTRAATSAVRQRAADDARKLAQQRAARQAATPAGVTRLDPLDLIGQGRASHTSSPGSAPLVATLSFSRDGRTLHVGAGDSLLEAEVGASRWHKRWSWQEQLDVSPDDLVRLRSVTEVPRTSTLALHAIADPPPGNLRTEFALLFDRDRKRVLSVRCAPDLERPVELTAMAVASQAPTLVTLESRDSTGRCFVLDGRTGKARSLAVPVSDVRALALSPDGHTLALAAESSLALFTLATGKLRRVKLALPSRWTRLRFSSDGQHLFVAYPSPFARPDDEPAQTPPGSAVVSLATGALIASQQWAQRDLHPVAISPRGTVVFAALEPTDASFWGDDELRPTSGQVSLTVFSWPARRSSTDAPRSGRRATPDGTWQAPAVGQSATALAVSPGLRHVAWTDGREVFLARLRDRFERDPKPRVLRPLAPSAGLAHASFASDTSPTRTRAVAAQRRGAWGATLHIVKSFALAVLLPILSLGAFLLLPGGEIAPAEGCGGGGYMVCWHTAKAKASWAMPSEEVPTNAWLRFSLEDNTSCSYGGVAGSGSLPPAKLQVELLDAQLNSLGAPEPLATEFISYTWPSYKWRPSTPLMCGSAYTLRLTGIDSGNAIDLDFHTGWGAFVLPALPAIEATVTTVMNGDHYSCCEGMGGCPGDPSQWCRPLQEASRILATVALDGLPKVPKAVALDVETFLELSEKGGDFTTGTRFYSDYKEASVVFSGNEGPFCLRVRYLNTLDNTSTTSPVHCLDTSGLDLSSEILHCDQAFGHTASCDGQIVPDSETEKFYQDRCENAGGGGQSGGSGGGAAGGGAAGGGAAGGGVAGGGTSGSGAGGVGVAGCGVTSGGAASGGAAGGGAAGGGAAGGGAAGGDAAGGGAAGGGAAGGGAAGGGVAGGGAVPGGMAGTGLSGRAGEAGQPAPGTSPAESTGCQVVSGRAPAGAPGWIGWLGWMSVMVSRRRAARRVS